MLLISLIAICFIQGALAQYGAPPEYPRTNMDMSGYPQQLPYSTPYYEEAIYYDPGYSSESESSEEDHCHERKIKHAHCPKRLKSDGTSCKAPHTRKFYIDDKEYLEVTCKSDKQWTALVTNTGKIITVARGQVEHVLACARHDNRWKTYTFYGHRIQVKHVFCVQGGIVDKFFNSTKKGGECRSCTPLTPTNEGDGVASTPVLSNYTGRHGAKCLKQTVQCSASNGAKGKFAVINEKGGGSWTAGECPAELDLFCDEGTWKNNFQPVSAIKCKSTGNPGDCAATTPTTTTTTTAPLLPCATCAPFSSFNNQEGSSGSQSPGAPDSGCITAIISCSPPSGNQAQAKYNYQGSGSIQTASNGCPATMNLVCNSNQQWTYQDGANLRIVTSVTCKKRSPTTPCSGR